MMRIVILIALFRCIGLMSAEAAEYGIARTSTPVMNDPDFKAVFGGASGVALKTDRCGQVRELEYIAMPGTLFTLVKKLRSGTADIYQVETDEYTAPPNVRLYVDGRFIEPSVTTPVPRKISLPSRSGIISALKASAGSSYVWGGNVLAGVPELEKWYYKDIRESDKARLTLSGVDCSGLLYRATGGWTPRNTSQLITYGRGVAIAGKTSAEIATLLQPLDLIVWNGHVIIVLDRDTTIESRLKCGNQGKVGVVMTQLSQRIAEIMRTRHPANALPGGKKRQGAFVVRRWNTSP